MPVSEPPKVPGVDQDSLDSLSSFIGDSLCRQLDSIEESIEYQGPIWLKDCDPLCRELDRVEDSATQLFPSTGPMPKGFLLALDRPEKEPKSEVLPDPLHEILDRLEKETERQQSTAPPKDTITPSLDVFPQLNNKQSRDVFISSRGPEAFHREPLTSRQYSESVHKMTGHSTGIRNSGNGFDWYCNIREQWVSRDECDDCPDFEETDYEPEDKADKRCRHSFSSYSSDEDKNVDEHFELGDESDE